MFSNGRSSYHDDGFVVGGLRPKYLEELTPDVVVLFIIDIWSLHFIRESVDVHHLGILQSVHVSTIVFDSLNLGVLFLHHQ